MIKIDQKTFRHIDLFSGIGGFAYAAKAVWGKRYETALFCDNDRFCQEVLKKRFPGVKIWGDIREIITDTNNSRARRQEDKKEGETSESGRMQTELGDSFGQIDLLTGGFPCQGFSQAGKRRGTSDDRYLWPEMFECIRLFKPRWVLAENVRGILSIEGGLVFEQVCADLENADYEVWTFVIPAAAVNAPHRRDRVWFVAHSRREYGTRTEKQRESNRKIPGKKTATMPERPISNDGEGTTTDTNSGGIRRHERKSNKERTTARDSWQKNWIEVAAELCRVDDGLPAKLDGLELSKSRHRVERLKSLGNAIVPQVAIEIMKAMKEFDER